MILTGKSEPKHLRIKGTNHAQKSNETRKSLEPQEEIQCNHESFHTPGGQILYKMLEKNPRLKSREMRSSPDG
jgi:hypothetical protein